MENSEKTPEELLKEIAWKIEKEPHSVKDVKSLYESKKRLDNAIVSLLEYKIDTERADKTSQEVYEKLKMETVSSLLQDLVDLGKKYRDRLGESFARMGFKILEQIRAGRRSDVEYSVVRIFITNGETIPDKLVEAFKPKYDDETFKAFMYAFIGSIIKPKEKEG